jgi:hypothetical protein
LAQELSAYGYKLEATDRSRADIAVRKAFIKDDSIGKVLHLNHAGKTGPLRRISIKLEVDTNPPAGSGAEIKYLDFPFIASIAVQDKPSLFAGKMHALLCRPYIKGRDWYDFLWYTSMRVPINYAFLAAALKQQGPWKDESIDVDKAWCKEALGKAIQSLDWKRTADDVRRFVRPSELPSLDLWSAELFLMQLKKL